MELKAVLDLMVVTFAPGAFLFAAGREIMCYLKALHQLPKLLLPNLDGVPPELEPVHMHRFLYEEEFSRSLGQHELLEAGVVDVAEHPRHVFEYLVGRLEIHTVLPGVLVYESDVEELLSHFVDFLGPATLVSSCHPIVRVLYRDSVVVVDGKLLWKVQVDDVNCRVHLFLVRIFSGIELLRGLKGVL